MSGPAELARELLEWLEPRKVPEADGNGFTLPKSHLGHFRERLSRIWYEHHFGRGATNPPEPIRDGYSALADALQWDADAQMIEIMETNKLSRPIQQPIRMELSYEPRYLARVLVALKLIANESPRVPTNAPTKRRRASKWVKGLAFADRYLTDHPDATEDKICGALRRQHVKGFKKKPTVRQYREARAYHSCQSNGKKPKPPTGKGTEKLRNKGERKESAKKLPL